MQAELEALHAVLETPKRPVAAIVAGSKVSTKLELLAFMLAKVQVLIIGGAMANTLLYAQGLRIGRSLVERDMADTARSFLAQAKSAACELILPVDVVIARVLKQGVSSEVVAVDQVPEDCMILDIGPATVDRIESILKRCPTLLWNGPVGAFEVTPSMRGTVALAKRVAELTRAGQLLSVAGGGDTVAAPEPSRRRRSAQLCLDGGAAHFSNGSKAANCPASRRSPVRRNAHGNRRQSINHG